MRFPIGLGTFGCLGLFGYVLVISVCFVVEFVLDLLNCERAGFSCVMLCWFGFVFRFYGYCFEIGCGLIFGC